MGLFCGDMPARKSFSADMPYKRSLESRIRATGTVTLVMLQCLRSFLGEDRLFHVEHQTGLLIWTLSFPEKLFGKDQFI